MAIREVNARDAECLLEGLVTSLAMHEYQGGLERDVRDYARQLALLLGDNPDDILAVGLPVDLRSQATAILRQVWAEVDRDGLSFPQSANRIHGWLRMLTSIFSSVADNGGIRRMGEPADDRTASDIRETCDSHTVAVDLPRKLVILDGIEHDVASEQSLRWLAVLASRPGEWISVSQLEGHDRDLIKVRTDRLRNYLPDCVNNLIETHKSRGSRIHLKVPKEVQSAHVSVT